MKRSAPILFAALIGAAALVCPIASTRSAEEEKPPAEPKPAARTDLYGDPLPPGAVARMGSVRLRLGPLCRQILFSADSKELISVGSDGVIRFWDPENGKEIRNLKVEERGFIAAAVSADGKTLAAAAVGPNTRRLTPWACDWVYLWDARTYEQRAALHVEGMGAYCLAFSPDGKTLAAAGEDKIIRLWDVESGKERRKLEGHQWPIGSMEFSPDGTLLAARDEGYSPEPPGRPQDKKYYVDFRMWDLASGKTCWKNEFPPDSQWIGDFRFLPSGEVLTLGDGVRVLNAKDGKELRVVQTGPNLPNRPFVISPDGKEMIAIGGVTSKDGFWTGRNSVEVLTLAGETTPEFLDGDFRNAYLMALSPDGKTLATVESAPPGGESDITRLWDWKARRQKEIVPGPVGACSSCRTARR